MRNTHQTDECAGNSVAASALQTAMQRCAELAEAHGSDDRELLPHFCGSACHEAIQFVVGTYPQCADVVSSTATLLDVCAQRPQCFSGRAMNFSRVLSEGTCPEQIRHLEDVFDFSDAAVAGARQACPASGGLSPCAAVFGTAFTEFPECTVEDPTSPGQVRRAVARGRLVQHLCRTRNSTSGESCGVTIKMIGQLDCASDGEVCGKSPHCARFRSSLGDCDPWYTPQVHSALCSECGVGILASLDAFGDAAGDVASSIKAACVSESTAFCSGVAVPAIAAASDPTSSTTAAQLCSAGRTATCVARAAPYLAANIRHGATASFTRCLGLASDDFERAACVAKYEASLRRAEATRVLGAALCSQRRPASGSNASLWCFDNARQYSASELAHRCVEPPSPAVAASLAASGCCLAHAAEMARVHNETLPAAFLPSGSRNITYTGATSATAGRRTFAYEHTALHARDPGALGVSPLQPWFTCAGSAASSEVASAATDTTCLAAEMDDDLTRTTSRAQSVPIGLAWPRVAANPGLRRRLEDALQADVAAVSGAVPAQIVRGRLREGRFNARLLPLEASSTPAMSAPAPTEIMWVPNAEYEFDIVGDESGGVAYTFRYHVREGFFLTAAFASVIHRECPKCIDGRFATLAYAANTPPGVTVPSGSIATGSAFAVVLTAILSLIAAVAA